MKPREAVGGVLIMLTAAALFVEFALSFPMGIGKQFNVLAMAIFATLAVGLMAVIMLSD